MAELDQNLYSIGKRNVKYTFAEYPSIKIYEKSTGSDWANHLLFGDYIKIVDTNIVNGRVKAKSRGSEGWVKIDEIRNERILEVNFVDIGQGDGCHVVTPDDKHIIIDAGKGSNMNRYLTWRFNLYNRTTPLSFPFTVIISHSDSDHYGGFRDIFDNDKIRVDKVYHNGLVERPGSKPLGKVDGDNIIGLVNDTNDMLEIINKTSNRSGDGSYYCSTLHKSLKHNQDIEFIALSKKDEYIEGYDQTNKVNNKINSLKILGPIRQIKNQKEGLHTIKKLGKDKNGHSIILKLLYGKARVLLGGDVNTEFGEIIHKYYKDKGELDELVVDVAKACHHGSNHFHYGFVKAINSSATVISSGDEESYSHPRPDTIGALGKCGYGDRPLIFSTELARSNKEFSIDSIEKVSKLYNKIQNYNKKIKNETDPAKLKNYRRYRTNANKDLNSFLTKYGMINCRTDGKKMILAQKLEVKADYGKWDIHKLEFSNSAKRFKRKGL